MQTILFSENPCEITFLTCRVDSPMTRVETLKTTNIFGIKKKKDLIKKIQFKRQSN